QCILIENIPLILQKINAPDSQQQKYAAEAGGETDSVQQAFHPLPQDPSLLETIPDKGFRIPHAGSPPVRQFHNFFRPPAFGLVSAPHIFYRCVIKAAAPEQAPYSQNSRGYHAV